MGMSSAEFAALTLFLTSKVRLHCDVQIVSRRGVPLPVLFLTSKVRLHCDQLTSPEPELMQATFS